MNDTVTNLPANLAAIQTVSADIGFSMPSDLYIGSLLRTLISSKPGGHFLELGTGTGLALAWMAEGLQGNCSLVSVDNDPELIRVAEGFFTKDERVQLICQDGTAWIKAYTGPPFDLVFADAWPGKYSETEEILDLIAPGGIYVIDDMTAQPNWPEGHETKVEWLVNYLEGREDFLLTKLNWSTGVILAVKSCVSVEVLFSEGEEK